MDNGTGLSAADVALLQDRNGGFDNMWGGNSMIFLFAILALMGGNWGNWGNNNAIGYNNLATQNDVQRGFDALNQQDQGRDILSAVTNGTAQAVGATNQAFHDNLAAMQSLYNETTRDIAALQVGQANILASQNDCCCGLKQQLAQVNYDGAMRDAATNANIVAQAQKILDALTGNRMADMQNQINGLQLQQALAGVVRYPNSFTYTAGNNPFCNCNCNM
jgi:hypothetical protein